MEMPVPCPRCGEWIELHDTRKSPLTEDLLCDECFTVEDEVYDLKEEADDIKYDLDNHAEHMKGDRRGWKNNLKELKEKIKALGFDYDEL